MLRFQWMLGGAGWASCTIADDESEATVETSYIVDAPEELLTAVAHVVGVGSEARAEFNAEPVVYRWVFGREGDTVRLRLIQLPDRRSADSMGREIWTGLYPVGVVARAMVRCFDEVANTHSESDYHHMWRRPFPRFELEALRAVWRAHLAAHHPAS